MFSLFIPQGRGLKQSNRFSNYCGVQHKDYKRRILMYKDMRNELQMNEMKDLFQRNGSFLHHSIMSTDTFAYPYKMHNIQLIRHNMFTSVTSPDLQNNKTYTISIHVL